eukprot:g9364.t1
MGCGSSSSKVGNDSGGTEPFRSDNVLVSKYKLGKKLGEGSYATVFEATDKEDKIWAVKIIDKSKCSPEELVEVKWEAEALQIVKHENITYLKEALESANYYYLVMEIMAGGELFDRIVEKEHYSEKMARDAIRTIAIALLHAHDVGVVHLDMKPENVLYQGSNDDDPLKICDFGISRKIEDGKLIAADGHFHGTPGYIPPEMVERKPYGKGCDVWAVGCLAYILLAGYPPFDGDEETEEGQVELFRQITTGSFFPFDEDNGDDNPWEDVSADAKDFIQQCFTVDQYKRPGLDVLLGHKWFDGAGNDKRLVKSKKKLLAFNAKRKLQGAIRKVISANRMKDMLSKLRDGALMEEKQ